MSALLLVLSVFLACAVEAVEIVLAAGTSRDWRSALTGVGAGLLDARRGWSATHAVMWKGGSIRRWDGPRSRPYAGPILPGF